MIMEAFEEHCSKDSVVEILGQILCQHQSTFLENIQFRSDVLLFRE